MSSRSAGLQSEFQDSPWICRKTLSQKQTKVVTYTFSPTVPTLRGRGREASDFQASQPRLWSETCLPKEEKSRSDLSVGLVGWFCLLSSSYILDTDPLLTSLHIFSHSGGCFFYAVDSFMLERLVSLAQSHGITLFITIQTGSFLVSY